MFIAESLTLNWKYQFIFLTNNYHQSKQGLLFFKLMPKLSFRWIKMKKYYTILNGSHKMCACKIKLRKTWFLFFINYKNFFFIKTKNLIENIHIRTCMNNFTCCKLTLFQKPHTFPGKTLIFNLTNTSPNYSHLCGVVIFHNRWNQPVL